MMLIPLGLSIDHGVKIVDGFLISKLYQDSDFNWRNRIWSLYVEEITFGFFLEYSGFYNSF